MNLKKTYTAMSIEKRAVLASNALIRGDTDTYQKIASTVPHQTYKQRDIGFTKEISKRCDFVLAWKTEHWKTFSLYLMNQRLSIEALNSGNIEEQKELQEHVSEFMAKLIALEAVLKTFARDNDLNLSEMLESELLISFDKRSTFKALTDQERRIYNELYTTFVPS